MTAEDVGTGADDMAIIRERTEHVVGLPGRPRRVRRSEPVHGTRRRGGDPGLRCEHRFGSGGPGGSPRDRDRAWATSAPARRAPRRRRRRARRLRHRPGQARRSPSSSGPSWLDPAERRSPSATCSRPARSGGAIDDETSSGCAARSSAARPTTCSPMTRAGRRAGRARDPLRARLHRQRRRADQRLRRAPRARRGAPGPLVDRDRGGAAAGLRGWRGAAVTPLRRPRASPRNGSTPPASAHRLTAAADHAGSPFGQASTTPLTALASCGGAPSRRCRPLATGTIGRGPRSGSSACGLVPYEEARRGAEAARGGTARRASPRCAAPARAPARLHEGPARGAGELGDGRGLVPDAGNRGLRDRPRRPGHLPRPGPAGRLPDRLA